MNHPTLAGFSRGLQKFLPQEQSAKSLFSRHTSLQGTFLTPLGCSTPLRTPSEEVGRPAPRTTKARRLAQHCVGRVHQGAGRPHSPGLAGTSMPRAAIVPSFDRIYRIHRIPTLILSILCILVPFFLRVFPRPRGSVFPFVSGGPISQDPRAAGKA